MAMGFYIHNYIWVTSGKVHQIIFYEIPASFNISTDMTINAKEYK